MTNHYLQNWKQYLLDDDYNFIVNYIENIKNNILNDKMIILSGPGRSGKSTLKKDIQSYLGEEYCDEYILPNEIIYRENIKKLGLLCGIHEIYKSKKNNRALINLIKYKQSFVSETNNIEKVNKNLLEYSRIIKMEHIF